MPSRIPPDTLPAKLYLLAWDPDRQRLSHRDDLGYLLRGAILADLSLRGCVRDEDGHVRASGTKRTGDQLLDDVLREMSEDRPRGWGAWVRRRARATLIAVEDQLAATGVVTVDTRRALGVFPRRRAMVTEPAALRAAVRDAALGNRPVSSISDTDAALVALAATGDLRTVLSRRERKDNAERIEACTARCGKAAPALRKVLTSVKAARASAAAAGGG
jgi:hypothetical protein